MNSEHFSVFIFDLLRIEAIFKRFFSGKKNVGFDIFVNGSTVWKICQAWILKTVEFCVVNCRISVLWRISFLFVRKLKKNTPSSLIENFPIFSKAKIEFIFREQFHVVFTCALVCVIFSYVGIVDKKFTHLNSEWVSRKAKQYFTKNYKRVERDRLWKMTWHCFYQTRWIIDIKIHSPVRLLLTFDEGMERIGNEKYIRWHKNVNAEDVIYMWFLLQTFRFIFISIFDLAYPSGREGSWASCILHFSTSFRRNNYYFSYSFINCCSFVLYLVIIRVNSCSTQSSTLTHVTFIYLIY